MTTIPFAFLRPPGCFSSSDACELLIRYPGGSISHCRNAAGAAHETFLALPRADGGRAVLIWKDPDGTYFRGRLATMEVAASGCSLAEVMPPGEDDVSTDTSGPARQWRPAEDRRMAAAGRAAPAFAWAAAGALRPT